MVLWVAACRSWFEETEQPWEENTASAGFHGTREVMAQVRIEADMHGWGMVRCDASLVPTGERFNVEYEGVPVMSLYSWAWGMSSGSEIMLPAPPREGSAYLWYAPERVAWVSWPAPAPGEWVRCARFLDATVRVEGRVTDAGGGTYRPPPGIPTFAVNGCGAHVGIGPDGTFHLDTAPRPCELFVERLKDGAAGPSVAILPPADGLPVSITPLLPPP